jgi:23S rRNA pseudouridine1911/1915/1917 synthase
MAYIGTPILGDFLYGERSEHIDRHALHAARLEFEHPADGRLIVASAPLPDDFLEAYEKLIRSKKND